MQHTSRSISGQERDTAMQLSPGGVEADNLCTLEQQEQQPREVINASRVTQVADLGPDTSVLVPTRCSQSYFLVPPKGLQRALCSGSFP